MYVNGPVLRSVVVFLLLGVSYSKRRCNYTDILSTYRELIFVELQNLLQHVLRSIHGMTEQFLCQGWDQGHGRGSRQQRGMKKPVEMMAVLIRQNCRHTDLVRRQKRTAPCVTAQRTKGKNRTRMRLIRALINCWQKLQSLYTPTK
ncbi:uncharacterized protein isoform X2 [Salmo salar]|uniref:Uncharacterized protein isoform X2 n=1 Tax=Salmo salar TaxID=8030 RepID=A0A1S3LGX5_SALSA|nr:uncharacterized protein LOC106566581 isoform X2 [Salmo salar]|eukprot:XP_013990191.1 PREDICTED: uncharacterized protein LOC106566581 isoform X4 [Salmo salar]